MEKDFEIYRGKKERIKSIILKAKKESSNDETLKSGSDDEEYAIASDSKNDVEDKTNDETCLMAQSSNDVTLNSSYYSDNASSLDNDSMQIEYDSLCEISLKIVNKNKILKTKRDLLEKEILELNEKIKKLERSKEIKIAPKDVKEALKDESWVVAMQEELNQFVANDVWELVPLPMSQSVIGTKWVFRNKLDKNGIVSRNKARLVAQGYNQQESIDCDETYAMVARLESIRILLAIACANDFKLYQMDVKSAFLNDFINEEVYVAQPPGFIDFQKPNYVYKLKKALYGLKKAP
ncbi:retrovirus-related pol polyprotein from transposon TNT 1-94 [Tanacetum coccineum]